MSECLFCKITNGELPSEIVWEDGQALAFKDINPQAPTHILVIPRRHIASLSEASPDDGDLLGHLLVAARQIAGQQGLGSNYRVVINNGPGAGQSVFHIHVHLLAGRAFSWPPG